jgi:hypothetical protein
MLRLEGHHTPTGYYYAVIGLDALVIAVLLLQYFGYLNLISNFGSAR